jgi:arsenate reductase-like glutaredoxin family protein
MDERLQKIVDEARVEFGLDAYRLEKYSIYKQRDSKGEAYYQFSMEWFPKELNEPVEEDLNPEGTASIAYNIQEKRFESVIFVQGQSFSTKKHFVGKSVEEVVAWVEQQTGWTYLDDFKLTQVDEHEIEFEFDVNGIRISPGCSIMVKFDEEGKLTHFSTYGSLPYRKEIEKSDFTLTLEEIEPLVKRQLQLIKFPSEADMRFVPAYAMEEVFVTVDGKRIIPFFEHERTEVKVDEVMKWDTPLEMEIERQQIELTSVASVEDAFGNVDLEKQTLTEEQLEQAKKVVQDVLRAEYPDESEQWKLYKFQRQENFIEAHCRMIEENPSILKRKLVVFIDPEQMSVLNFMDNDAMFEIFESFAQAEQEKVTHEEAFEKMIPYITLDPTYLYDELTGKYILCGLLDAAEAVDAVTGEIIALSDL